MPIQRIPWERHLPIRRIPLERSPSARSPLDWNPRIPDNKLIQSKAETHIIESQNAGFVII